MRVREKIKARVTPSPIAELLADLAAAPHLPGAACRAQTALFDATIEDAGRPRTAAALHAALQVCQQCRALGACTAWVDSLDPADRPRGVVAGRINTWQEDTPP